MTTRPTPREWPRRSSTSCGAITSEPAATGSDSRSATTPHRSQRSGADTRQCIANAKAYAATSTVIGVIGPVQSVCALRGGPAAQRRRPTRHGVDGDQPRLDHPRAGDTVEVALPDGHSQPRQTDPPRRSRRCGRRRARETPRPAQGVRLARDPGRYARLDHGARVRARRPPARHPRDRTRTRPAVASSGWDGASPRGASTAYSSLGTTLIRRPRRGLSSSAPCAIRSARR